MNQTSFGTLLRQYRFRTRDPQAKRLAYLTLERLGDLLKARLDPLQRPPRLNTISAWEQGISRPYAERRALLRALISVLKEYGGLTRLDEANHLLTAGGYAPLSDEEVLILGWLPAIQHWRTSPIKPDGGGSSEHGNGRHALLLSRLPRQDYIQFIGREETLATLHHALLQDEGCPFIVIQDGGGRGKTALAQRAIRTLIDHAPWRDIFWISARSEKLNTHGELVAVRDGVQSVTDALNRLVVCLGQEKLVGQPVSQQVQFMARLLLTQPYLVVVDNLELISESDALVEILGELAGGKTRFLLTTRYSFESHPLAQIITLPDLTYEESRQLVNIELRRRGYPSIRDEGESSEMRRLYARVGGTPLMLRIAAGLRFRYGWQDILSFLSDQPARVNERLYQTFYHQVWSSGLTDDARDLLLTMTDLATTGASETWVRVASGLVHDRFEAALGQLLHTLLIQVQRDLDNRYSLHSLTVTYLKSRLNRTTADDDGSTQRYFDYLPHRLQMVFDTFAEAPDSVREDAENIFTLLGRGLSVPAARLPAIQLLLKLHPLPLFWNYADHWQRLIEPAVALCEQNAVLRLLLPSLLGCWADVLHGTGHYLAAFESADRAIGLCSEAEKRDSECEIAYFRAAAVAIISLIELGRLEEAAELHLQALRRFETLPQDLMTPQVAEHIAHFRQVSVGLTRRMHSPAAAVAEAQHLIAWIETIPTLSPRVRANAYRYLAIVSWALGEYRSVVENLKTVLSLYHQFYDPISEGETWGSLGLVYWSMGRLVEAEEATLRFLLMATQFNLTPRYVKACGNLTLIYLCQKRLDQALHYVDLQIEYARQIGFEREVARGIGNRGVILMHQGNYEEALKALREDERYCRANRLLEGLGSTLVSMGVCLWLQGERDEAVRCAETALQTADDSNLKALRLIALRGLACCTDEPTRTRLLLQEALLLAQQGERKFDEAACLLSLAKVNNEEKDRVWAAGAALLDKMGALAWLGQHSPENPPLLPMIS
jgi:tetratricopeptide (TPR) repeat protein